MLPADIRNIAPRKLRMIDQSRRVEGLRIPPGNGYFSGLQTAYDLMQRRRVIALTGRNQPRAA